MKNLLALAVLALAVLTSMVRALLPNCIVSPCNSSPQAGSARTGSTCSGCAHIDLPITTGLARTQPIPPPDSLSPPACSQCSSCACIKSSSLLHGAVASPYLIDTKYVTKKPRISQGCWFHRLMFWPSIPTRCMKGKRLKESDE